MVVLGLEQRLAVMRVGDDTFEGWAADVPARVYGGEVAAQALAAANQTVGDDRFAHAIQNTYLRGGDPAKPLRYVVERSRDGRSFSSRRVIAQQDGRDIFFTNIGFTVTPASGTELEHQITMPAVPTPESLTPIADSPHAPGRAWTDWIAQHPQFEIRPVPADLSNPTGRRQLWYRLAVDAPDDPKLQSVHTVYNSDFTMIASARLPHEPPDEQTIVMTTLNHSVFVHRPFRSSDWHLVDHYSPVATGGRGLSLMHTYTPDGRLVASAVQEGLGRRRTV